MPANGPSPLQRDTFHAHRLMTEHPPMLHKSIMKVVHKGDEWRDHDADARPHEGGDLVAERLAGRGRLGSREASELLVMPLRRLRPRIVSRPYLADFRQRHLRVSLVPAYC